MRRIEIKRWNGGFDSPKVVEKIRRKIAGTIRMKETVLIDFEDVIGLPHDIFQKIVEGWDVLQVKVIGCGRDK